MAQLQNQYSAFLAHLRDNYESGITCQGHSKDLVPYSVLDKYWTPKRIRELLRAAGINEPPPSTIRSRFLLVISILCFNGDIELLPRLVSESQDDRRLPWEDVPGRVQDSHNSGQLSRFFDSQWRFCPTLIVGPFAPAGDLNLHRDTILAFRATESTEQGQGRERNVHTRAVLQGAHSHLPSNYLSFPPHLREEYFNERASYSAFTPSTPNVTRLLGSYSWFSENKGRTGNLILEHAEHGSLLNFFEKESPPYKPDEISSLWTGIAGIAKGVESIHEQHGSTGLHLDLKPANVVVSSGDDPHNKFSFIFKIIDFEFSHITPQDPGLNGSKTARAIDRKTSKTYAPPELVLGDEINYHVGSEVDLWSLGCIILECAVWISLGERGRLDFIERRTKETGLLSDYTKSGRGDCFHNGRDILRCVRDFGQHIRDHGRRDDETTSQIFDLVLRELLVEKDRRQPARSTYSAMKSIIDTEANRRATSIPSPTNGALARWDGSITGQPVVASPTLQEERASSYTSRTDPEVRSPHAVSEPGLEISIAQHVSSLKESPKFFPTIDDVRKWIEKRRINGNTPELRGWNRVQAQLNGRDFIFVIDNSQTMQDYEDQVKAFVHCLAKLVKRLDPDGAEIMCTSDPMNRAKFKHATGHSNFVTENFSRGRREHCNMELALENALDPIGDHLQDSTSKSSTWRASLRSLPGRLVGRRKPVTVIVFTDGVWGSSTGGGAEKPIQALIGKMRDRGISRSTVAIQFLRFGSNPAGKRRLEFLDDALPNNERCSGLPQESSTLLNNLSTSDIVDTKPTTASIWDILIGPVDEHVDQNVGQSMDAR
ncbi:unnamed protein product [Clonostachys rosea]|uniref:non-specific serine/threonine protein kinase n=1 Tax=Bionectria ochroleuca TaxID=29856 RepID=A0ABY6UIS7_BIOOC|nr:unnamed protein product [Clonostachys rosea]